MSNDLIEFEAAGLPSSIAKSAKPEDIKGDLSGGVTGGFPIISYRGKIWRLRQGGDELIVKNEDGDPKASIEIVMLKANPHLSKIYYKSKYSEGDSESPDCFSVDGVKPDPAARDQQSATCASCPHNVWGSRITDAGKKSKACSDNRRVAVAFPVDMVKNGEDAKVFLLRIPAATLSDLKTYGDALGNKGYPYYSVVTRVSFDMNASYPHFQFRATQPLDDALGETVVALRDDEKTEVVLGSGADLASTDSSEPEPQKEQSNVVDLPPKAEEPPKPEPEPEKQSAPKQPDKPEPVEDESKVLSELDDLLGNLK